MYTYLVLGFFCIEANCSVSPNMNIDLLGRLAQTPLRAGFFFGRLQKFVNTPVFPTRRTSMSETETKVFDGTLKIRNFDGKLDNQRVRLRYNLEKHSVRIICTNHDTGSEYLRQLIIGKYIGEVDSVIWSKRVDSKVVALMRGNGLDKFLRGAPKAEQPQEGRKSFSQIASESETGS